MRTSASFTLGNAICRQFPILILLFVAPNLAIAQEPCKHDSVRITGTITSTKKEPLVSASVSVKQNGKFISGAITDFDGNYEISNIDSGLYDVTVIYVGYESKTITRVVVTKNSITSVDISLTATANIWRCYGRVILTCRPLTDKYDPCKVALSRERIKNLPY